MLEEIKVVPYNLVWPHMFKEEASLIKEALGENCLTVHHIGSTAVPGLSAKPVLDMIPVVRDITKVNAVCQNLETLGYEAKGEFGIPFRRYFRKNGGSLCVHVHIYEEGNSEIMRHLNFRDWMRQHPQDRDAYAHLKQDLVQKFAQDRFSYCLGKESFIDEIGKKAGSKDFRIVMALTPQEWEAYHRIREEQIFAPLKVLYDRQHPTLTAPTHYHFVLKKDHIVTVAHVELLSPEEAALRSLATDEDYKKQGAGSFMMELLEKWVSHQGRKILKMHAGIRAENFYRKRGYVPMVFKDPCISQDHVDLGKVLS